MCFKEIASRIRNVTYAFNQIDTLLDKHYKMSFHMEAMLDKLAKQVDRIYEIVAGEDAAESGGGLAGWKAKKLTHPDLIKLRDELNALDLPQDRNRVKFHNTFSEKYNHLLLYYQKHNNSKVHNTPENKVLYDFVKNQKTNLRMYQQNNDGPFAKDTRYIKFLKYLGVTYR
jgi:hypothetical protein